MLSWSSLTVAICFRLLWQGENCKSDRRLPDMTASPSATRHCRMCLVYLNKGLIESITDDFAAIPNVCSFDSSDQLEEQVEDRSPYEVLLDEDGIEAVKDRRKAIGTAIDDLHSRIEHNHTLRRQLDEADEQHYLLVRRLDAAHARISRNQKYTEKAGKRLVRRFWSDETYQWVERFLFEWARKQLMDGPRSAGSFTTSATLRPSLADAVAVMRHNPDVFEERKSAKPKQKYARSHMEWVLIDGPGRHSGVPYSSYIDVQAALASAGRERAQTLSESMHQMLEDAIKQFYAGKFTSVVHAFSDLFWKDFASSVHFYRYRVSVLEVEVAKLKDASSMKPSAGAENGSAG